MYIVLVCFGIVTISVLCSVIEIKTEVELICLAVCLGLSLEDLVLEQPIFKSAHNKKTTEGFYRVGIVTIAPTYRPGVPGHRCCSWNALGSISNSSVLVVPIATHW